MKHFLAIGVLASLVSHAAYAQSHAPAAAPKPVVAEPAGAMFKALDANGDGQLSLAEFRAGWQRLQAAAEIQAALARQFAALDANHDRAIDAGEYGGLMLVKNAGKAAPPLARFDADGDGKVEFAEYVRLVETLAPQQQARKDGSQ
jgi:Ca2+-binding EF-hand superfamily protein